MNLSTTVCLRLSNRKLNSGEPRCYQSTTSRARALYVGGDWIESIRSAFNKSRAHKRVEKISVCVETEAGPPIR